MLPDSDDDFHLQLPTPPQLVVVDGPPTPLVAADDSDDQEMQIFVNGLQKLLCLQVLSSDTISTIEALVANKADISRSKIYLVFNAKKLEDGSRALADLEIPNEASLQMVLMIDAEK